MMIEVLLLQSEVWNMVSSWKLSPSASSLCPLKRRMRKYEERRSFDSAAKMPSLAESF